MRTSLVGMFLTFYQLNNKQVSGKCIASSVPLIPKYMGLMRTEDPSRAYLSDITYGHGLVEADCPRGTEDGSHVVILCLYHLVNFPKLTNIGWGVSVSEPKFTSDGVKAAIIHELPEAILARICFLIKGGDTPPPPPLLSRAAGD